MCIRAIHRAERPDGIWTALDSLTWFRHVRRVVLDRLRRPEYTGENRCRACTVVNVAVLLVAVTGLGVVAARPLPAAVVGLVGAVAIALRGYLLPFTPRFAPALVAPLPGEFFAHDAPAGSETLSDLDADAADSEAVLRALVEAGVVTADGDHLGVTPAFEADWRDRMDAFADAPDDRLTAAARESTPSVTSARVERTDSEAFLVVTGASGTSRWIRRPVAIAEIAAVATLCDTDLPAAHRAVAADALCAFLDTCPACGDDIVEGRLDDCCGHSLGEHDPERGLACETCGVAFHRFG